MFKGRTCWGRFYVSDFAVETSKDPCGCAERLDESRTSELNLLDPQQDQRINDTTG